MVKFSIIQVLLGLGLLFFLAALFSPEDKQHSRPPTTNGTPSYLDSLTDEEFERLQLQKMISARLCSERGGVLVLGFGTSWACIRKDAYVHDLHNLVEEELRVTEQEQP